MYTETILKFWILKYKKPQYETKKSKQKKEEFNKTKNPKIKQNKQKTTAF